MVLATRCPHCETVFRLQDAQLARSGGRVRCGHCQEVFDASQNLLGPTTAAGAGSHAQPESQPEPQATPAPAEAASAPPALSTERVPEARIEEAPRAHSPEPEAGVEPVAMTPKPEPTEPLTGQARAAEAPKTPEVPEAPEAKDKPDVPHESHAPHEPHSANAPEVPPASASRKHEPAAIEPATESESPAPAHARETIDGRHRMNSVSYEMPSDEPREPTLSTSHEPFSDLPDERQHGRVQEEARLHAGGEPQSPRPDDEPRLASNEPAVPAWEPDPEPRFRTPPQAEPGASQFTAAREGFRMPPAAPSDDGGHFAVTRERRASAPRHTLRRVFGTLLCMALAVLLVAQLAWWRRETVMVYWPDSQPLFAQVCTQLGCRISPPRDIDGLQVEASDLRQVDGPHKLELRVPLRNRYSVALAYPAIELTLFDARNEVAIRRVLWPQDYLPPGTTVANGLPARTTQTMIVRLDSGNAIATNFRVQIFYP